MWGEIHRLLPSHHPDLLLLCILSSLSFLQQIFFLHASPTKFLVPFPGTIHGTRSSYHTLLGRGFYHQRLNRVKSTRAELLTTHLEIQNWSFCSAKAMSANARSAAETKDIYSILMSFPDISAMQISLLILGTHIQTQFQGTLILLQSQAVGHAVLRLHLWVSALWGHLESHCNIILTPYDPFNSMSNKAQRLY